MLVAYTAVFTLGLVMIWWWRGQILRPADEQEQIQQLFTTIRRETTPLSGAAHWYASLQLEILKMEMERRKRQHMKHLEKTYLSK